jgi:hypothetical protein
LGACSIPPEGVSKPTPLGAEPVRPPGQDGALPLEPQLRGARRVGLHHLFEKAVLEDRWEQVPAPGHEIVGRDDQRKLGRDLVREERPGDREDDAAVALDAQDVHAPVHAEIVDRLEPEREAVVEREEAAPFERQRLPGEVPPERVAPRIVDEEVAAAVGAQDRLEARPPERLLRREPDVAAVPDD